MNIKAIVWVVALNVSSVAAADNSTKPNPTDTAKLADADVKIVSHVKHVNDMEIEMGKLAQANGGAASKKYGEMLVKDHTANNTILVTLAKKKGVATIPAEVPDTDTAKQEHKKMMDAMAALKALKGAVFDAKFLAMMATDHDAEVVRLDAAATTAKDTDLANFLKITKPVVKGHADQARQLQTK